MAVKYSSKNIFKDLGFSDEESIELKFKADLYAILKKAVANKDLSSRDLEKLWDVPQPRVSEVMTGKLEKVSITRLLNFLFLLGIGVQPVVEKRKRA